MKNNKKYISNLYKLFLLFLMAIAVYFSVSGAPYVANADVGPKPSIRITFNNMGDELCYGTLLSKNESMGPYSAWDGETDYEQIYNDLSLEIWQAFAEYEDADGYYYLQVGWKCSETKNLNWLYYPPNIFKILLYYPESDTFVVSGSYEKYAFDSYYTVNMDGISGAVVGAPLILTAEKSYDYTWEAISLVCRIVITILIEIGIALLFRFKQKKVLTIITVTNVVTQILLNVALNLIRFYNGALAFLIFYFLFEIAVFIIEAIVYGGTFNRVSQTKIPVWKSVLYALISNALSFGAGFVLTIPGIT